MSGGRCAASTLTKTVTASSLFANFGAPELDIGECRTQGHRRCETESMASDLNDTQPEARAELEYPGEQPRADTFPKQELGERGARPNRTAEARANDPPGANQEIWSDRGNPQANLAGPARTIVHQQKLSGAVLTDQPRGSPVCRREMHSQRP